MSQEKWFNKKTKENVKYLGRRNKLMPENREFVDICRMSPKQLKNFLIVFLMEQGYTDVAIDDGFVFVKGDIPYCLTAHMDTVHTQLITTTYELKKDDTYIISSPQGIGGDDRCGVYMIMQLVKKGYKPSIVFCEDEEKGCIGSGKFVRTDYVNQLKDCKMIIELDRAGSDDAVYYQCDNKDFIKFIDETIGYKESIGSCSDISTICPVCGIAGVNLSCGYYNAHTLGEYVNMKEMADTTLSVEILLNTECEQFEYVEKKRTYYDNYYYYGNYYSNKWDSYWLNESSSKGKEDEEMLPSKDYEDQIILEVMTKDCDMHYFQGRTSDEAWLKFFMECPNNCYNDVIDWYEYRESEWYSEAF